MWEASSLSQSNALGPTDDVLWLRVRVLKKERKNSCGIYIIAIIPAPFVSVHSWLILIHVHWISIKYYLYTLEIGAWGRPSTRLTSSPNHLASVCAIVVYCWLWQISPSRLAIPLPTQTWKRSNETELFELSIFVGYIKYIQEHKKSCQ